ncbi:cystine/glutamate transporter-like [Clarias gariepinus]|uniref:cystine/glutamate transporter-like n=1 Tax=Clarias gariepinus TaxID=13013 RepID=UPI00234D9BE9|nr:cystine/glutamate transporter-like [Clarias gariepinus]
MANQKAEDEIREDRVHLRRSINLVSAVSFIIGNMVGSGIFIAPKGVHMNTGSVGLSLIVWVLCGLLSTLGALCYAELGTSFKKSGGHYTYLLETLGPLPAFLRLWSEYVFLRPAVTAYVSLAFGHYIIEPFFTPCPAPLPLIKLTSFLGVTFLVAVNCWSVSLSFRTQVFLLIIKLFALVLIIVPGITALAKGRTENFENAFNSETLTLSKLPLAFYSGLYAFSGWFVLNFVTEEVINPKRNIPLAIILSMITVSILYLVVNVAYYTVMTGDELLISDAVAVTFASKVLPRMASMVPLLVAMSCFGTLNSGIFSTPRMLFVAAREGQWPALFSMIHIRRNTPMPAVLFMAPPMVIILAGGEIYPLINFASFSRWLFIALVTLGLLIHRYRFPDHPRTFKVHLAVPVTFTVVCFFIVGLSLYSDPWNTGCSLAVTFTGIPVYYLTVKHSYVPIRWRKAFDYCTLQLQILLEVVHQEVHTY